MILTAAVGSWLIAMVLRLVVVTRLATQRVKQLWKALSLAAVTVRMMAMHVTLRIMQCM